ncbi:MAG: alpha/beta fold hydrolase [Alphaproteobacteria bacterium]|nr:alpha/beta fold hydrolase [Alphaproteobacteria bacterium]
MLFGLFARDPKPFDAGWLAVGGGHEIYYHQYGRTDGPVVLCFHGGPGSSSKARHAATYGTSKNRVILFDQRGCGKSRFKDLLAHNTTADLLSDAEKLLSHLNVRGKITVAGGSWGSAMAVLFAQKNPALVSRIIISMVFIARPHDWVWPLACARTYYPDMVDELEKDYRGKSVEEYYSKLLGSGRRADALAAVKYYANLEFMLGSVEPKFELPPKEKIDDAIKSFKIYMHYILSNGFLRPNQILADAKKIAHIPCDMVHNRLDMVCPMEGVWALHKALPKSKLVIVPDHGHWSEELIEKLKKIARGKK